MITTAIRFALLAIPVFVCVKSLAAQQTAPASSGKPAPRTIVATVNGQEVTAGEVELEFRQAYRDKELDESQRKLLLARARDQVIDRKLVLGYLHNNGFSASNSDVDLALAQLEKQLAFQDRSLKEHCQQLGVEPDDIRQTLLWKLSWQRFLAQRLTDENLQKYFDRNKPHFDGTQLRVAHILLKPQSDASEAWDEVRKKAEQLRADIIGGKLEFGDAAAQHSSGPSAKKEGDIGWIERRQPMPESFSAAAFDLKPGEISPPIETTFGVHLIKVLESKPGTKTWQDAVAELKPAVTLYLFRWIADRERMSAKIERASDWPK